MDIFKDDIVYIYEYKDRNNIKSFNDLIKVCVDTVVDNSKNIIVSGKTIVNGCYIINANGVEDKTQGIVVYKEQGPILYKGSKKFFISYKQVKKGFIKDIKEYSGQELLKLYVCLRLDDNVEIKLPVKDICFETIEESEKFTELIKIKHPQLLSDRIIVEINGEKILYFTYEVYVRGNYISENPKERLFNYACKYKNPIEFQEYDFKKIFSMRHIGYEVSKINNKL